MPSFRFLLIALVAVTVCYFLLVPPNRPTWLPLITGKQTYARTGSLALGISLAASYGTISVQKDDGSFEDIGSVEGNQDYLDMMRGFSLPPSSHPAPPYDDIEDQWDDQPRQWLRSVRKLLFLPASSEVRTLSTITSSLVYLAKSHISPSSSISSVVITYPALHGLYAEDISDTALYLSLPLLPGNHRYPPRTIVSAYAGNSMGLCPSFTDENKCTKEGLDLPVRSTILIEYTSAAVLLHATSMREAYDLANPDADILTYFSFPKDDQTLESANGERRKRVREMVMSLLHKRFIRFPRPPGSPETITVLLTGNSGDIDRDRVHEFVAAAVKEAGFEVEMSATNPEFIAARGAATLAWRALSLAKHEIREL